MRLRTAVTLLAVAAAGTLAVPAAEVAAAGSPPACTISNNSQQRCSRDTTVRPNGSIGLIGDSVLLGSADGMSTPGLPSLLAGSGWGPISFASTLGMKAWWGSDSNVSAWHWVNKWYSAGWHPSVIAVNIGANHLAQCEQVNGQASCAASIRTVMDKIDSTTRVWWAKVNTQSCCPTGGQTVGASRWNAALDQVAAERSNLFLWDWPAALASATPAITMDLFRIHPASAPQYVKRSNLIAADINYQLGPATFNADWTTTPPPTIGATLQYLPAPPVTVVNTAAGLNGARLTANEVRVIDLSGVAPGDAQAAVLTVGAYNPAVNGYLTAYPCGIDPPLASNVNFEAGGWRAAQAITTLGAGATVCVTSNTAVDIFVSVQGWLVESTALRFDPVDPVRLLDTRESGRQQLLTVEVPAGAAAVSITLTATRAAAPGRLIAYACDTALPDVTHLTFGTGETVAGAAYVPASAAHTICIDIWTNALPALTDVVVDLTGTYSAAGSLTYQPAAVKRMLDTRTWMGGWIGRHGPGQTIDVVPAPTTAQAVVGTLTMVQPTSGGYLTAAPCGAPPPAKPTSSVNAEGGYTLANSVTVGLQPSTGKLCLFSSVSTHTIFDVTGWWVGDS